VCFEKICKLIFHYINSKRTIFKLKKNKLRIYKKRKMTKRNGKKTNNKTKKSLIDDRKKLINDDDDDYDAPVPKKTRKSIYFIIIWNL
jgi:hypothetical protein